MRRKRSSSAKRKGSSKSPARRTKKRSRSASRSRRSSSKRKRSSSSSPKKSYTLIDYRTGKELGGRYLGTTPMEAARKVKIWRLGLKDNAPKALVVVRQTTPGPLHGKLFAYNIIRRRVPASPAFFALTGQKTVWDKMIEALAVPPRLLSMYNTSTNPRSVLNTSSVSEMIDQRNRIKKRFGDNVEFD